MRRDFCKFDLDLEKISEHSSRIFENLEYLISISILNFDEILTRLMKNIFKNAKIILFASINKCIYYKYK